MFHFSQLAVVSEQTTDIVTWISIGAIALLAVVLAVTCIVGKKFSTSEIAFAGVCIASSVTLSFIKIAPVQYGGSITLARLVPPLIYAYKFGPVKGTLAGIVIGLFDFITNPYILTPMTFVLDYILAFASIGLMGLIVYIARFTFHLLSGFIYFAEEQVWADLPMQNMFIYSFVYQCVYLPADCAIAGISLYALAKTKALDKLFALMTRKEKTADTEQA